VNLPQFESLPGPPIPPPSAEGFLDPGQAARTDRARLDRLPTASPQQSRHPTPRHLFPVRRHISPTRLQSHYPHLPLPSPKSMSPAQTSPTCRQGRALVVQIRSLRRRILPINEPSCRWKRMERQTGAHRAWLRGVQVDKDLPWRQSRKWPVILLLRRLRLLLRQPPRTTHGYTRLTRIRPLEPRDKMQKAGATAVATAARRKTNLVPPVQAKLLGRSCQSGR